MFLRLYVFLGGIFVMASAFGQPAKWTLEECIDYGVERSLQMQRQRLQNKNERLNIREAVFDLMPSVNTVSPRVSYNYGRGIDPETNTYTNIRNKTVGGFSVGTGLTLFAGFGNVNRLRAARISGLRGLEETEKLANDVAIQIMNAFFTLVYAGEKVKIIREQADHSALQLKKMQREYELGRRAKSDLFDVQAQQASDEYQLVTCRNDHSNALLTLKHLMNYAEEQELEVAADELVHVVPVCEPIDMQSLYDKAMNELPEALVAAYDVRIKQLNLYMAKASLYPSFSMSGGMSFGYYSDQSEGGFWKQVGDKNRIGKNVGISMNIPIFSGLGKRSNVSRARNSYRDAQLCYEQREQTVFTEIQKAILDLESVVCQYDWAKKKEEYSLLSHTAGKKRYEQGLINIIDLNITLNNLLQAKYDLLKARLDYVMQKRMVEFYKGVPLQNRVH